MKKIVITLSSLILALDVLGATNESNKLVLKRIGNVGTIRLILPPPAPAANNDTCCRALESQAPEPDGLPRFRFVMPSYGAIATAAERVRASTVVEKLLATAYAALTINAADYAAQFFIELYKADSDDRLTNVWTKARCICPFGTVDLYFGEPAVGKPDLLDAEGVNPVAGAVLLDAFKKRLEQAAPCLHNPYAQQNNKHVVEYPDFFYVPTRYLVWEDENGREWMEYENAAVIINLMDQSRPIEHKEPIRR
jgi:hypothetical protein